MTLDPRAQSGLARAPGPARPRVLMPSLRALDLGAAWCSHEEFEDVVRQVDDVEILPLHRGRAFEARRRLVRSLAFRGWVPRSARLNPGLQSVTLDRDYDLLAFTCMNLWDLTLLDAIRDWDQRCRIKVCFIAEFYAEQERELEHLLPRLARFDHVFLSFSGSVPTLAQATGASCHHLAAAADVLRFTPFPACPPRVIDLLSVGRRSEPLHRELLKVAGARGLFYVHDTIPGSLVRPTNAAEHRAMLANLLKRSRFFVTYPAKFGDAENHGQSEVGNRYYEGSAAGAILVGHAPEAPAFRQDFPWDDAVVDIRPDGSDVADAWAHLATRADELDRASRRGALHALRHHDWAHRWEAILKVVGLPGSPALSARLRQLESIALAAESSPEGHAAPSFHPAVPACAHH